MNCKQVIKRWNTFQKDKPQNWWVNPNRDWCHLNSIVFEMDCIVRSEGEHEDHKTFQKLVFEPVMAWQNGMLKEHFEYEAETAAQETKGEK